MIFRKEEAYQHALCMDLTTDRFRFSVVHPQQKTILDHKEFEVKDFTRESVGDLLTDEILQLDFGNYILSSGGVRNTLIPVDLFSYSKPAEIFKLNYPEPIDNLDYNRIPELGIVNIYELPLWIKSLFVIKFPRVKIIHRSTVLLKGVFDQPTFSPKIHIYIENGQFYFLITKKSKLIYFNRFDYKELSDMVYYILFVLEQKELDQNEFDVNLYGVSNEWEHLNELQSFFSTKVKIAGERERSKDFIMAKQLLCV